MQRNSTLTVLTIACTLASSVLIAQRGPAPDPLVRENATVKLAPHTYVIPDNNVGLVPNVGIVVGSRATLVIDPGLGRRNGETVLREVAKVSKNSELFIASTHFHAEHTTGYIAFPASAKYINSTVQEAEFEQGGMQMVQMFSGRSPATAEILKDAARRPAAITFERDYHARSRRRSCALPGRGPDPHAGRHGVLRRGRQRPLRRRRRHEQFVSGGDAGVEHEGLAGGVRHVRGVEAADDRAGTRRSWTRRHHRNEPGDHAGGAGARSRVEGRGQVRRRGGDHGPGGDSGATSELAAGKRACRGCAIRLRGSSVTYAAGTQRAASAGRRYAAISSPLRNRRTSRTITG